MNRRHVLMDIDHTLSHAEWRDELIGGPQGWDHYHQQSVHDAPAADLVELVYACKKADLNVIGLTTRPEKWRALTNTWMIENGVLLDELLMRPDSDYRPTALVKLDLAIARFGDTDAVRANVMALFDDHDEVIAAFRTLGVTCLQTFIRREE